MNQDQLKLKLDEYTDHKEFTVIFSGKHSVKVDGLYHPEKQEIIIHNKNFTNDDQLMYTALHELAHHVDLTENRDKTSRNAHGGKFRSILHLLVEKAIENGDYKDFSGDELDEAVKINKEHTILLKRFGKSLIKLLNKCQQEHHPYEDLTDRKLALKPGQLKSIMAVYAMDISEEVGGDFAREVVKIKDPVKRKEAEEKGEIPPKTKPVVSGPESELAEAEKALRRIEKSIANLEEKRQMYEDLIEGYENE